MLPRVATTPNQRTEQGGVATTPNRRVLSWPAPLRATPPTQAAASRRPRRRLAATTSARRLPRPSAARLNAPAPPISIGNASGLSTAAGRRRAAKPHAMHASAGSYTCCSSGTSTNTEQLRCDAADNPCCMGPLVAGGVNVRAPALLARIPTLQVQQPAGASHGRAVRVTRFAVRT